MANPPKKKGTGYETEVVSRGKDFGLDIFRTSPGMPYDVEVRGNTGRIIEALTARADRGRSLVLIPLDDLFHMLAEHGDGAHIECKRYARVSLHTIYERKFDAAHRNR